MKDNDHIGDLLRSFTGSPEPRPGSFEAAEEALQDVMKLPSPPRHRRLSQRRSLLAACLTLVALVALILAVPPSLQRSELRASVEQVARAAELVDPVTVTEREFIYQVIVGNSLRVRSAENLEGFPMASEYLIALVPQRRETWYGSGGTIQLRTLHGQPTFFRPEDEVVYFAAGLDRVDRIGETVTETAQLPDLRETWPSDPDELREFIASAAVDGRGLPTEVEHLEVAMRILRDVFTTPRQRAAVLLLVGDLPGMKLAATDNPLAMTIEYEDRGVLTRQTLEFDSQGWLVRESFTVLEDDQTFGIPAGTTVSSATYTRPVVLQGLQAP